MQYGLLFTNDLLLPDVENEKESSFWKSSELINLFIKFVEDELYNGILYLLN